MGVLKRKPRPQREETVQAEETKTPQKDSADFDALLDEIDGVLETNAEEFVRAYTQKGGQ